MNSSPAFQFYPKDYLSDSRVELLTLEEEGIYIRLLCRCWLDGSIPADPEACSKLAKGGSTTVVSVVQKFFEPHCNDASLLVHLKLESERKKQHEWRLKSMHGGKKSASKRMHAKALTWGKGGSMVVDDWLQPNGNIAVCSLQSAVCSLHSSSVPPVNAPKGAIAENPKTTNDQPELLPNTPEPSAPPDAPDPPEKLRSTKRLHPDTKTALGWLNEKAGRRYRETEANLTIISQRLQEPEVDIEGVKLMIDRQCHRWTGTSQAEYLRPETLFRRSKFDSYYAARELPIQTEQHGNHNGNPRPHRNDACF